MAKLVELCGSPGVGKSSIFEVIEQKNRKNASWTCATDLYPKGREDWFDFGYKILKEIGNGRRHAFANPEVLERPKDYIIRILRTIRRGKDHIEEDVLKEAANRFVAQYPAYMHAIWSNIYYRQRESYNGLDLRFEKSGYMYRVIKKLQLAQENQSGRTTIIDEGVINLIDRALYKSLNLEEEREEVQDLVEYMPLPSAVVYIETDLQENIKRLGKRKELRDMHQSLTPKELVEVTKSCRARLQIVIELLGAKGIPILYIDGLKSIEENAQSIVEFTENLAKKRGVSKLEKLNQKVAESAVFPRYFG